MAMAIERRTQRPIDPLNELAYVVVRDHPVLHDRELVAAQPSNEVLGPDRFAQPLRYAPEELVADQMAERVVDALEFVDIDVEDCEGNLCGFQQQTFRVPLKQRAVRQISQRIIMREMLDPRLHTSALGDILHGRGPASVRRSLVDQPDGAPVRHGNDPIRYLAHAGVQKFGAIFVDIADEGANRLTVEHDVAQVAPRLHDIGRDAEHVDIALVADHETGRPVEQYQTLSHVVDGGVEMQALFGKLALRGGVLAAQLAHDQEYHREHDAHGENRSVELQLGLRPP